jgi:hypothetical protein
MTQREAPSRDQPSGGDSQNANTSSLGPGVTGDQKRIILDELLDCLGWQDGEFTAVCHRPAGGIFTSAVVKSVDASATVRSLPGGACIWFSVNPTGGPERHHQGRGCERDVTRWAGLPLDLDVKEGGFRDLEEAAKFIGALSEMVGTCPSASIYSGHGIQPLWPIEDGELDTEEKWDQAYRLSRRFESVSRGRRSRPRCRGVGGEAG